ncbi:LysE family translocator [Kiloniella sp. b19]|uniref:LysE family translocator n=1 Tax=Kiloniella sp. GXU_MW_B19 TaxID=3141326 RepID=UPI0031E489D2
MNVLLANFSEIAFAVGLFVLAAASPGPATLMIMGTAMKQGRQAALFLSSGIICGSLFWAAFAAFGLLALLEISEQLFQVLKYVGGGYLLYLAFKNLRSSLRPEVSLQDTDFGLREPGKKLFTRGLLIHLTNPKPPAFWLALLSTTAGIKDSQDVIALIISLCCILAATIFVSYSFLFSSEKSIRLYKNARRPIEGLTGGLLGLAALKLLTLRTGS